VVEFKILGGVEVVDDVGPVSLGGPQQRKVLAVLLSDPGTTLTYDRLLDVLWPDGQAPENARRTAISYVSRLRSALGEGWVSTSAAGYQLDISSASVDALRFAALVDGARNLPPERAIDVLDEALALWRGPVFGDLHGEWWALPAVSRLDELHLAAFADRVDALSAGGWDGRALSEVQALVAAHPLRGPFVERLMRGLEASGRTDEALRAFEQHRTALIERTGLDPSDELIALDRSIASAGQLSIPADSVGRALRGYVLRDVIGEGSFGTVYRATQPHVGRDVAVKVVRRELADDRAFIHRFEAEARMVARLEHPHIVPLYDFWREPGGAFLVFRLLRGGTAEQELVATGSFEVSRVTRVLEQIGGALGSAHAAGVVHRDVKPANILFDEDGEAYLTDFGIATGALEDKTSPSSESPPSYGRRSAGSPMYASPEQARDGVADARADQYALAATVWELLTGQPPFEGATAAEVIKVKLEAPLAPVRLLRPDVPARLEEVLARASAIHPDDRFATVAEFVASWQSALAVSLTTTTAPPDAATDGRSGERLGVTALTMSGLVVNPFKGLRPFGEADAADFFGRERIVGELHQLVKEQRFTAVVGPSGSGKSSLVLAGLVPELKRGGFLVARFTPGADPFDAFSAALIDLATAEQARGLSPDLLRREGGLVAAVDALAADDALVIVIDQLEELWTTTDDDERTLFAASLADLHRASSRARVVATVRADWFDRPLRDPSLGPLVARATFGITPMEASELYTAISEPAARIGVRFEAGLVGRLVTEALDQPGSLPLLQFALAELFDRRSGATITAEVYDQIGGLSGSVAHQAESLYANFTSPDQLAVRRLFARLVTAGDGAEDTRRRARQSELVGVDDQVVNALVDRRLLTLDRDRESREPTVEIAHEALLRGWPRLREWLDEDRDWVRELRALASATRLWESSGRDDADLYRGARLAVTSELALDRTDSLTPDEAAFLDASARLVDAERIAAEARTRTRERQNRRLRRSLVGLGVVTVVALIAGLVAIVQSNRADDQATEARAQAALAAQRSVDAETQRAVADEQRSIAEEQRTAAEDAAAQAKAAEADTAFINLTNTSLLERGNRQDLAALLAIEAYRIDPERSRSALFSTFTRNVGFLGYRHLDGANAVVGIVPLVDGETALGALDGGRLVRFDIASASILDTLDPIDSVYGLVNEATMLRLSGDGRIAVLAVQGGEALTWRAYDVSSGRPLAPPVTVPFAHQTADLEAPLRFEGFGDASVSVDGSLLAISGGAEGQVLVFDTADGSTIGTALFPPPDGWPIPAHTASVEFDDDDTLYVGVPSGEVMSMDPRAVNGQPSVLTTSPRSKWSSEYGLRFSDDGRYLITFGSGAVSRIDLPNGTTDWTNTSGSENLLVGSSTRQPMDSLAPCRDVVLATNSDSFYCTDDFGSVFEQSASTGVRTQRFFDRQRGVTGPLALTVDHSELLASSLTDDSVALWKLDGSGPIQSVIASEGGSIATWGYNATGSALTATSTELLDPAIWDPVTGQMTDPLDGILIGTWAAAPDRHWSAFFDGTSWPFVVLYDTTTHAPVPGVRIDFEGAVSAPYPWNDAAHDRMYLAWSDHIKTFDQEGTETGPTITPPATTGLGITSVQSTPDGTKLVVSLFSGQTYLYDAATGTQLDVAPQPFMKSVVSPNGVAVGSTTDGRLYVFDPNTLEVLDELPGLHGYAEILSLSDDGSVLAASNESGGIKIYDVPSLTELGDGIADIDGSVNYFSLRPDGKQLAVPYGAPGVVLWDLDPQHWLNAACELAGRNLTQDEWDQYLSEFGQYHQSCDGDVANL